MRVGLNILPGITFALLLLGIFSGCTEGNITDSGDKSPNIGSRSISASRIVLTVYYEDTASVVVTTAENPNLSEVISPPGNFGRPSLSPSLERVAFKDFDEGYEYVFDEVIDSTYQVRGFSPISGHSSIISPIRTDSIAVLWSHDSSGFWYTKTPYSRFWGQDWYFRFTFSYNFELALIGGGSKWMMPLTRMSDGRIAGIGKGYNSDTSIVISERGKSSLTPLTNPYLYFNTIGFDPSLQGYFFEEVDWSDELGLFVLSCRTTGMPDAARFLVVTDLDGSVFYRLTSGDFADINPRWAPNGSIHSRSPGTAAIIFQRYDDPDDFELKINSRILELILDTLEISDLISKDDFPGSVGVGSFDI